jgi:hypothetical protein
VSTRVSGRCKQSGRRVFLCSLPTAQRKYRGVSILGNRMSAVVIPRLVVRFGWKVGEYHHREAAEVAPTSLVLRWSMLIPPGHVVSVVLRRGC